MKIYQDIHIQNRIVKNTDDLKDRIEKQNLLIIKETLDHVFNGIMKILKL
jgi:hypothetical protein